MIDVSSRDVFDAALALPESQRAELAEQLWSSLEEEPQEEVRAAWASELRRRMEDYRAGRAVALDGPAVMDSLKRKYGVDAE